MSYSSLWVMDKDFKGEKIEEFKNSWLFSPFVWDSLYDKYITFGGLNEFGGKRTFMIDAMFDNTISPKLNEKLNNSQSFSDRVLWEMSNQQIFYAKDKECIKSAIEEFVNNYKIEDHIKDRFIEISESIMNIDETEYPYFIFKNTSVDDNVEYWFRKYNEEEYEHRNIPLSEIDKIVTEFVIIKDNKMKFTNNIDYFNSL